MANFGNSDGLMVSAGIGLVVVAAALQKLIPSPPPTTIGVDLGTTFSCVAVFRDGMVRVIEDTDDGNFVVPSMVFIGDNKRVVGPLARDAAVAKPGNLVYDAKRFIGKRFEEEKVALESAKLPFKVVPQMSPVRQQVEGFIQVDIRGKPKTYAPEEISAMVLARLRKNAEKYVGREIKSAVLAVPVAFSETQRNATREAAKIVGLEVIRMIHEPTAAAMAYGLHNMKGVDTVLVFDMGGGTLDVSLLNVNNGIFEVMAASGDNHLGGQDFNRLLQSHFLQKLQTELGMDPTQDDQLMHSLRSRVEEMKIELSEGCDCGGTYDDGEGTTSVATKLKWEGSDKVVELSITRNEFEQLSASLFQRMITPVEAVLASTNMQKDGVDEVVLVGGSTRIPHVRAALKQFFNGKMPNCAVSPEEAVAHGTAIQAAILSDRSKVPVGATEAGLHKIETSYR